MAWRRIVFILVIGLVCLSSWAARRGDRSTRQARSSKSANIQFQTAIKPLLSQYCYACHGNGKMKGDLALDAYHDLSSVIQDRPTWEKVLHNLRIGEMPPKNKPQPSETEREQLVQWVESEIFPCDCDHPDPGRVTIRRLNRVEYNNTIRDLIGIDFQPAEDFPADDIGYGFDNIGDVLSLPPILLEKYLAAAGKILDQAIITEDPNQRKVKRFNAYNLESTAPGEPVNGGGFSLNREGELFLSFKFPRDGQYILRARAYGQQAGPEPTRMTFRLAGKDLQTVDVTAVQSAPKIYETKTLVQAGARRVATAYINNYVNPKDPDPKNRDRNLIIDYLEIEGPIDPQRVELPPSHRRIFICQPASNNKRECAREILAHFTKRAYRRPVSQDEVDRLLRLFDLADGQGESFEKSIQVALQAVLVSPHFLFRGELQPDPNNPQSVHPINDYALASRLSYFLWSSMPDDELFAYAERGLLRRGLERQVRRMLHDPKSKALVEHFGMQWLQIQNLNVVSPDKESFPEFDVALRLSMRKETELFFETILREDRSVLEFLDSNFTFLNDRLARHYEIPGVHGDQLQRVSLKNNPRGGLLTQASILTITSNPTRTSPVKRGKWVLDNILGAPPPPPPPDVPELSEDNETVLSGSLRQRMEQHRANTLCASCHARMDPIGFGFENFDAIGAWRDQDGRFPIDPSGRLVSGESFRSPEDLKNILLTTKKDDFVRCLSQKMLTYALGRGLEYYDKCAINEISKKLAKNNYRFSSLVLGVVNSAPFQMRRGEGDRLAQAKR